MNINDLTLGQLKEIQNMGMCNNSSSSNMIGKFVVIRTFSAGVHTGYLAAKEGRDVDLKDARRIHRWKGANTLNEVSQSGVDKEYSRISEAVPLINLTQVIEIIPCSEEAKKNLEESRWPEN